MFLAVLALAAVVAATGAVWPALQVWLADLNTLQLGVLASFVAGMFTAVGAIPVFFMRRISRQVEDSLMGFGAGVMLFVISHEIIPESHRKGHEGKATFGVLLGFIVMLSIGMVLE